jgi:hypothetical protein
MHKSINLVGGDTWFNCLASEAQNFSSDCTSVSHAVNNFWRLNRWFIPSRHFATVGIWWASNGARHASTRAHDTWLHATLKGFVTALIFATTSAPARVVCRGHHAGLGHNIHCRFANFLSVWLFQILPCVNQNIGLTTVTQKRFAKT